MTPEQRAREVIDRQLAQCGWIVQDHASMNLSAGPGLAIREFPLQTGFVDYMLCADGKAIGVVEAKPEGKRGKLTFLMFHLSTAWEIGQ